MKRILILSLIISLHGSAVSSGGFSLPEPPPEFFALLAKTKIVPGAKGYNELRMMLSKSVVISPYVAAKLYNEGKLMLGDTRTRETYNKGHALGAICLPVEEVDFMRLKPIPMPILLY